MKDILIAIGWSLLSVTLLVSAGALYLAIVGGAIGVLVGVAWKVVEWFL